MRKLVETTISCGAIAVFLFLAAAPVMAEEGVTQDVLRMLEEEVSETIITGWLESTGKRPKALTSDELIALTRAGASDELLAWLLEISEPPGGLQSMESETARAYPKPEIEVPVPAVDPNASAEPDSARSTGPEAPDRKEEGPTGVAFSLEYRPWSDEDSLEEEWDLYLYLDGEFLAKLPDGSRRQLEFSRDIEPGQHRIAFLLEQHTPLSGRKRDWHHEARVLPESLAFHLLAGGSSEIRIRWKERWSEKSGKGPFYFRLRQDGETMIFRESFGRPVSGWPALCEDIEANRLPGGRLPAGSKGSLKRCFSWTDLWGDVEGPGREPVRTELEVVGFEPDQGN